MLDIFTSLEIIQNANRSLRRSAFWVHFLCVAFSSLVLFFTFLSFICFIILLLPVKNIQFHLDAFCKKKKMKKTKFSTQKYPAVNFVLRKTLDATKMESAYIHTSIHVSSDENEKEKKPYRKIIIKDKINRYSLIKNDCRPTIFGGFFFVSFACAIFLVFVISRFVFFSR